MIGLTVFNIQHCIFRNTHKVNIKENLIIHMAIARGLFQQNTKKSLVWNFEIKYFRLSLYGNMVLFYYSCVCLFCIVVFGLGYNNTA